MQELNGRTGRCMRLAYSSVMCSNYDARCMGLSFFSRLNS